MALAAIHKIKHCVQSFEKLINFVIGHYKYPEPIFLGAGLPESRGKSNSLSLKDILDNSILWAVPRNRRTVEKRLNRKFGFPQWHWKPLVPKTNLLPCLTCGHHYEAGALCQHCYTRIQKETEEMQEAIQEKLGLEPVENEVVLLYEGENPDHSKEFWKGKRIIEMKKPRPDWFSKNLLERSTAESSESTDVKPTELA